MATGTGEIGGFRLCHGLPAGARLAAAALWWRGMGRAVLPAAAPRAGIRWAAQALRPEAALIALAQGRTVGLAGLRGADGGLIDWGLPMRPVLGPLAGLAGRAGLGLWRGGPATADLILDGLAVHPRWQRRGVARALIEAALAEAARRGHPGLRVEVLAGNHGARALYAGAGFATVARHRLGHGRRALTLRRAV